MMNTSLISDSHLSMMISIWSLDALIVCERAKSMASLSTLAQKKKKKKKRKKKEEISMNDQTQRPSV